MKKVLFSSFVGAVLFAGCSATPTPRTSTDYQVDTESETMMGEETMMNEEVVEVSNSTELNDIEEELQSTTISEEDFSDL